jgi:hypothetical protein
MSAPTLTDDCPTCDDCGLPITTSMQPALCQRREQCALWPEDEPSQAFLRKWWPQTRDYSQDEHHAMLTQCREWKVPL